MKMSWDDVIPMTSESYNVVETKITREEMYV